MKTFGGQRWHDMGGGAAGALPMRDGLPADHDFALWEKRVDALLVLMTRKGHFTVDGLRRALEDMGEDAFETMSYYERWIAAVNQNLIEDGVYSLAELGAKMEQVRQRGATYGQATDAGAESVIDTGAPVRVRTWSPPGHLRTPSYLRGKSGLVERRLGPFANPEQLAYGLRADRLPLYRVRFTMAEIWGDGAERPDDTLEAEIYAHWLEADV